MPSKIKKFLYCSVIFFLSAAVFAADSDIKLNSLGFLPNMPKKATIISQCCEYTVKKTSNNKTVYSDKTTGPFYQQDVNQTVWIADFSAVKKGGKYYLDVPGVGRSIDFEIGKKVYDSALYTAMRGFYLWRCGTAVEGRHNGIKYSHTACHLDDGWEDYISIKNSKRDGTGGWHDAGDYGKYTVNAGVTMGALFLAWDNFKSDLKKLSLDIPDTMPGLPDFLKELKWETDWLLKMRYPDGSGKVSHKLTRLTFCDFVMPEKDSEKRYFTDWSSAATADFAAVLAMAARYFKPYDKQYANTCLKAAEKSYEFLRNNPQDKKADQSAFKTGGYDAADFDDRLWAAAEVWETTGELKYLNDFEKQVRMLSCRVEENFDWGNVQNLGIFTYLMSKRQGRNAELLKNIRSDLIKTADNIVTKAERDVYGRPMSGLYYWGCNGTVARQVLTLQMAYRISKKQEYIRTAFDAVGHLFGRNYYGRSYVTGLGHNPPMNPHDRRSGADGIKEPWPGYLVGGGHTATDWQDVQEDYKTNEIAINWQAGLVYALAGF